MSVDITVPEMGESVRTGIIAVWLKQEGERVEEGEELFELETDKATVSVPSTASGRLSRKVSEGDEVEVGRLVATIETFPAGAVATASPRAEQPKIVDGPILSPAVRRIVEQYGIELSRLRATGPDGRITKEDALAALLAQAEATLASAAAAQHPQAGTDAERGAEASGARGRTDPGDRLDSRSADNAQTTPRQVRRPMSGIRKRIAENLVESQRTSAHLTTFNEIDMSAVSGLRTTHREAFEKRHAVRLGFMSFFVRAVCDALREYPSANSAIDGDDLLINNYYNIGVAVSTDRGLLVPVIRDADTKSFAEIESEIVSFALRAREKKIGIDELTGGTFSITNGGVFGSLLSTPIPTPGQAAILGMHTIQKRPVVIGDSIEIRPMMYVALTYDHRIMDGREAVSFLVRVKEHIEDPGRLLLGM